ncbi:MAG: DUF4868 domain-containing protein [Gammaproteobacteria bacterium]|nr:DUF4868 domain-containing protein [Gammaproteobacteria bacterium]
MDDKIQILNQIKGFDFNVMATRLWVVKKRSQAGQNTYRTLSADIDGLDADFRATLRRFFCGEENIAEAINQIEQYSVLTNDTDEDRALIHSLEATDFAEIISKVQEGADNPAITNISEFNNAWALIIQFTYEQRNLYAFSKIKGGWNLKTSRSAKNWVFREGHFEKVQSDKIFTFRNTIDFVAFENDVFIRDKANYELGLNIREGLEAKRDELVEALEGNGIIASVDDLKVAIGTNKTLLRRLVAAEETRYFEDEQFIEDMKAVITEHEFHLPADDDGKFIIDQNNIDLFLKLINDKRFLSLIKKQMVDADAVQIVAAPETV